MVETKTMGLVKYILATPKQTTRDIAAMEPLEDTKTHINRFAIKSHSGNIYIISQHPLHRYWMCGCPGFVHHQHCKHMEQLGLASYHRPMEATIKLLGR